MATQVRLRDVNKQLIGEATTSDPLPACLLWKGAVFVRMANERNTYIAVSARLLLDSEVKVIK